MKIVRGKFYRRNRRDIRQQTAPYVIEVDTNEEEARKAEQEDEIIQEAQQSTGIRMEKTNEATINEKTQSPVTRTRSGRVVREPLKHGD